MCLWWCCELACGCGQVYKLHDLARLHFDAILQSVRRGRNVAVSGGPGAGKSTLSARIYQLLVDMGEFPVILCHMGSAVERSKQVIDEHGVQCEASTNARWLGWLANVHTVQDQLVGALLWLVVVVVVLLVVLGIVISTESSLCHRKFIFGSAVVYCCTM